MVRKDKKKLVQKQKQTQKQIVNIRIGDRKKVTKRRPKKDGSGAKQEASPYASTGFTPVYIQSGVPPSQDLGMLQTTILGLQEQLKNQPIKVEKQLIMRQPMVPTPIQPIQREPSIFSEVESGFDFGSLYKENPLLEKITEKATGKSMDYPSTPRYTQASISPIIREVTAIPEKASAEEQPRVKGRLPKAKNEDEIRYEKELRKYQKAVNARKITEEKALAKGTQFKARKPLPPPPTPPTTPGSTFFPYSI
jgi:hypothetical protein